MSGGGTRPGPALGAALPSPPHPPSVPRRPRGGVSEARLRGLREGRRRGPRDVAGFSGALREGAGAGRCLLGCHRRPAARTLGACPALPPRRSAAGRPARFVARLAPVLSPPGALERLNGEAAGLAAPLLGFDVISAFSGVTTNVFSMYNVMFMCKIFYS